MIDFTNFLEETLSIRLLQYQRTIIANIAQKKEKEKYIIMARKNGHSTNAILGMILEDDVLPIDKAVKDCLRKRNEEILEEENAD